MGANAVAVVLSRTAIRGRYVGRFPRRGTGRLLRGDGSRGNQPASPDRTQDDGKAAVEKAGADHLLFVVHPRDGDWALTTIRKGGDTFESRADLPAAWAGLTDAALEKASSVQGAKFCHNARFIAVASTREAALRMAELAVELVGQSPTAT